MPKVVGQAIEVVTVAGADDGPSCGLWLTEAGHAALEQGQEAECTCGQLYVDLVEEVGLMLAERDREGLAVLYDVAVALTRRY